MSTLTLKKSLFIGCCTMLFLGAMTLSLGDRLVLNVTKSLPVGFYWSVSENSPYRHGDIVTVCLIDDAQGRLAQHYGRLTAGNCPEKVGRLIKIIRGIPHDKVTFADDGVWVNGELIPNSKPFNKDRLGQTLPKLRQTITLNDGEYILMGTHLKSFDSRYLGVFHQEQLQNRLKRIWVLE